MSIKPSILILFILLTGTIFGQKTFYNTRDEEIKLTKLERTAAMWFDYRTDSTRIDSIVLLSSVPFNWNDDTVFFNKKGLDNKLKEYVNYSPLIDTIFTSDDSLKKFFTKSVNKNFDIIEIRFYAPNSLRSVTILVAVSPSKNKVIGYFFLGDLKYRKRYGITGFH